MRRLFGGVAPRRVRAHLVLGLALVAAISYLGAGIATTPTGAAVATQAVQRDEGPAGTVDAFAASTEDVVLAVGVRGTRASAEFVRLVLEFAPPPVPPGLRMAATTSAAPVPSRCAALSTSCVIERGPPATS